MTIDGLIFQRDSGGYFSQLKTCPSFRKGGFYFNEKPLVKNGAWLDVNRGGSRRRIAAMAG